MVEISVDIYIAFITLVQLLTFATLLLLITVKVFYFRASKD